MERSMISQGIAYDAAPILGHGAAGSEALPEPDAGAVAIRVDAWSLRDLRNCETVVRYNLMWHLDWIMKYSCSRATWTPGVYRVRLPIPNSNKKDFSEQMKLLLPDEEVAQAALVATALLCHLKQTGEDLLSGEWTRCAEALPGGFRVGRAVDGGRVIVHNYWDGSRLGDVWLAGCRKC